MLSVLCDPSPSLASISNISVGSLMSSPSARRLLITNQTSTRMSREAETDRQRAEQLTTRRRTGRDSNRVQRTQALSVLDGRRWKEASTCGRRCYRIGLLKGAIAARARMLPTPIE